MALSSLLVLMCR